MKQLVEQSWWHSWLRLKPHLSVHLTSIFHLPSQCCATVPPRHGPAVMSSYCMTDEFLVIVYHSIILHSPGLQFLACIYNTIYNITLLPSVNTLIAQGMFCGAKYTHHTFTPIIKHLITTTANKHPGKKVIHR